MTRRKRVIGTAGHIDHGKTSLVRALTGVDTDRLPEEKARGITIDLGFASWLTDEWQIGFVDVPGHERFVRNMLAGVGGIDAALLVVAADESVKPQTREHLAICDLLAIPGGVIAITKTDLVEPDIVELVRLEIEDLVTGTILERARIVPVSSAAGTGLDELRAALIEAVVASPERDATHALFRLPIDRAFTLHGFGSIVTGTAITGSVRQGDELELLPERLPTRVRSIEVHGESRDEARAGERTSLNLADRSLDELHRGQTLAPPGTLEPSQIITARLTLLPDASPLRDQARIRFHHLSAELLGRVRIVDSTEGAVEPGSSAFVQIRLESPVAALAGDRFVIRRYSPPVSIGGGIILDPLLPKFRRGTRDEVFRTLLDGSLGERVTLLSRLEGSAGLSLGALQKRTGLSLRELKRRLNEEPPASVVRMGSGDEVRWIHEDARRGVRERAIAILEEHFRTRKMTVGLPKGELLQKLFRRRQPEAPLVSFFLHDLANEGIIVIEGDMVDVPGRSKELGGREGELAELLEKRFRDSGLKPPPFSELMQTIPQRKQTIEGVISYLVRRGKLVRIAEGIWLHPETVEEAAARLRPHEGNEADVAFFKEIFGISRKVVIPLLEHFDAIGLTRRVGDRRLVLPPRDRNRHTTPES